MVRAETVIADTERLPVADAIRQLASAMMQEAEHLATLTASAGKPSVGDVRQQGYKLVQTLAAEVVRRLPELLD